MIRLTLLWMFIAFVGLYAWKDWYKALCGLILLMGVIEHPDMPRTMFGIQGLNPWNILCIMVLMGFFSSYSREKLKWDMPSLINILLIMYVVVIFTGFFRLLADWEGLKDYACLRNTLPPTLGELWSENIINSFKWVIPGLLLFVGCNSRSRFYWGIFAILGVYLIIAIQVIKWMPLSTITDGGDLSARSSKILINEIGYHRVNLSMMLSGAAWATLTAVPFTNKKKWILFAAGTLFWAQALTGGRTGYGATLVVGFMLCIIKWRKYILLFPLAAVLFVSFVPGVYDRLTQGFSTDYIETNNQKVIDFLGRRNRTGSFDLYTITAGRVIAWPFVIDEIKKSLWIGYGRQAMQKTGTASYLLTEFREVFPHPHNAYLQFVLDNGVIGFFPVCLFYLIITKWSYILFKDRDSEINEVAGGVCFSLLLALFVASIGSQTFYPREGAVGMWCAIGLMLRVYIENMKIEKESKEQLIWNS